MKNVLEYLELSAERFPDKIAFADENSKITYMEFVDKAKKVGTGIAKRTSVRTPIPIIAEKSVDTLIAFMGSIYAGCFYILVDPKHPEIRRQQILDKLDAKVILFGREYESAVSNLDIHGERFSIDQIEENIDDELIGKIRDQSLDIDPLYTNFTSGSTGVPKGVVVSHRSVIDFIDNFTEIFEIDENDVVGNQAPFDFDVSVKDIYSTIKVGARMEIITKKLFSFPTKLLDYIEDRKVTTLIWAVSALCMITTLHGFDYKVPEKIKKVLFSGEVMPVKHLNLWRKYLPKAEFVNLYGPTEITCNCTYYKIEKEFQIGETIPIGIPFPNEKVFLLDEDNFLVEPGTVGTKGEICVSGTALALGYYADFEQTESSFVQNPYNTIFPELIYKTGDIGYYDEDGQLCYVSRKDFQIKHMGHRIELREIELAIEQMQEIDRVCCLYDEKSNRIYAYYEGETNRRELMKHLKVQLPIFMMPNVFNKIDRMPMTKNGKIDRKALLMTNMEEK